MPFNNPEPYDVDPSDGLTRGRLRLAAANGDQRAKATLKPWDQAAAAEREAAEDQRNQANAGSTARGRDLYRATHNND